LSHRLRCCVTNRKVAGSIPAGVSGFFIDIKFFQSHYGSGVDSASKRNEYQECFLGQRRPVRKADNLPPYCAVVTKSGNLNFLEPLGPIQACNGSVLPCLQVYLAHIVYLFLPTYPIVPNLGKLDSRATPTPSRRSYYCLSSRRPSVVSCDRPKLQQTTTENTLCLQETRGPT